jgi:peptidoglycan/xylan/chitin deacetylase (PgdA/CDA1 family)
MTITSPQTHVDMSKRPAPTGLLAPFRVPPVFVSVDLDSWVHSRWASGSQRSLWSSSFDGYQQIYGARRPGRDFDEAMETTLALLDEIGLRITFFVLSEIAELYPSLMRQLDGLGHEIALHGRHHVDNTRFTVDEFRAMARESRCALESIIGKRVVGYRAANLILSSEQLTVLDEEGFDYDSSVCPSRKFFGKFGNMTGAPTTPYYPSGDDLAVPGQLRILELPHGVMPILKLPCSTGIMTRVLGGWWGKLGTLAMLRKGYALYYFHPYEVGPRVVPPTRDLYARLSAYNFGAKFRRDLSSILAALHRRGEFLRGCDIASAIRQFGSNSSKSPIGV